jgi:aldehyde:ferredoxin oxidoreductase
VEWVDFFEDLFSAVNCLQTCQFTAFGYLLEPPIAKYTPKPLLSLAMLLAPRIAQLCLDWSALSSWVRAITGVKMSPRGFLRAGRRVHTLERRMNCDMGIRAEDDTLPARFLEEGKTKHPRDSVVPIAAMVRRYYRVKGYGPDGRPTARALERLGLAASRERRKAE